MSDKKKEPNIIRPGSDSDIPDAPVWDMETGERATTDRRKVTADWFRNAKAGSKKEADYSVTIDPKQAVYAKKYKKKEKK